VRVLSVGQDVPKKRTVKTELGILEASTVGLADWGRKKSGKLHIRYRMKTRREE
jgi:hypothetical protein